MRPLEKVWASNDSKGRIFINVIGWVAVNMYLAHQYFVRGGKAQKTAAPFQVEAAHAMLNNPYLYEAMDQGESPDRSEDDDNDPADCVINPRRKSNWCKYCHNHRTL